MQRVEMDQLTDVSNVLVLGSTDPDVVDRLTAVTIEGTIDDSYNLLGALFTRSSDRWIDGVEAAVDTSPSRIGVVSTVDADDPEAVEDAYGTDERPVKVESVPDPGDLPRLGITLSEFVSAWGHERPTVLAFDSVTAFLQYADTQRVYRFLHTLKGRLDSANGVGIYFLDPAAHEDQTIATLRPLFDEVVEYDAEADPNAVS